MRTLTLLAVAVLLLAGCAGTTKTTGSTTPSTSGTNHGATSGTSTKSGTTTGSTSATGTSSSGTGSSGSNHAPTANLTASSVAGISPFNVTFTLKGSDADGDALTYTFDADGASPIEKSGNGTAFPVTVTFQYAVGGNFTARLTVSDGKLSANQTHLVKVTGTAGALVNLEKPWTTSVGGVFEFAVGCQQDGVDCAYFPVPKSAGGHTFIITFTAKAPAGVYFLDHYDSTGYVDTFIGDPAATSITGKVAAGTTELRAYASGGADFKGHLVIT